MPTINQAQKSLITAKSKVEKAVASVAASKEAVAAAKETGKGLPRAKATLVKRQGAVKAARLLVKAKAQVLKDAKAAAKASK